MRLRKPADIASLLAVLTSVGPISTDMYLPAFPMMRDALHGDHGSASLTLAAWFLGLAIGQITFGPLSDRIGRRRPLLLGTLIYGVASVGCALSSSITMLSEFRVVAAFGGAASLVIPRAVIRDLVRDDLGAARLLSRLVLVMGIVPVLAPTLGGVISSLAGWRAIFAVASLYGFGCALLIWRNLPETLPRQKRRIRRFSAVLIGYLQIARERVFLWHALEGSFATFSLFAFLGGATRVFEEGFALSPIQFGLIFVLNAGGYVVGAQLNARLMPRFGADRLLTLAAGGLLLSTVAMLLCGLANAGPWGVIVPFTAAMTMLGFVLPGAAIGSMLPHTVNAGSASALYGTMIFFVGGIGTLLVGVSGGTRPIAMAALMVIGAAAALLADRMRPRRSRVISDKVMSTG